MIILVSDRGEGSDYVELPGGVSGDQDQNRKVAFRCNFCRREKDYQELMESTRIIKPKTIDLASALSLLANLD